MRFWIGILLFICGISLALYLGIWVMFIGGIIGLIEAVVTIFNSGVVEGWLIGASILKIMFAGLVGYLSGAILIAPAMILMEVESRKRKRKSHWDKSYWG